jgi:hypothetical protein
MYFNVTFLSYTYKFKKKAIYSVIIPFYYLIKIFNCIYHFLLYLKSYF